MLAGGCGSAPAAAPSAPSKPASASVAAASQPAPTSSGAAASAKPAASASAKPAAGGLIKVGILAPLTGPLSNSGKDNQDGFNLYLDSVNGTMAGRKIDALWGDEQANAEAGLLKAKQFVESDKVPLLMGITQSAVAYPVADYVAQAQIPLALTGNAAGAQLMKHKSPYLMRFTQGVTVITDPQADWVYKHGYRKAIVFAYNNTGGLEFNDGFASAFVKRGGSIIQDFYPSVGTSDYGPFLAQLNSAADVIVAFLPGVDGLHFLEQFSNYGASKKPQIIDTTGAMTSGANMLQLKDKGVGVIAAMMYSNAIDSAENRKFMKLFHDKFPNRELSSDVVEGYSGAQVLESALKTVSGQIEDKQSFLSALYKTDIETARG
ncbi:MAG TPA: ABC transporter substrate-binding protein, partial [Chloroflexota bacterium]